MAKKGGKQPGAGRPKGVKNKATLVQKAINDAFNQRVMVHAGSLFQAQLTLAVGSVKVFRVDEVGEGKEKKRVHTLVSDSDKIQKVLDETDGDGGATVEDGYYFVTHVLPDNKAIDSMLNRALGKPTESLKLSGELQIKTFAQLALEAEKEMNG